MSATKVDFKRELPDLYRPGRKPVLVEVPELSFLMVDGHGDPNTSAAYVEAIEALFSISYTLKFTVKHDGPDYAVMPLEGLWWSHDMATFTTGEKSAWNWTAMIMQPDFVTDAMLAGAVQAAQKKRALPAAPNVRLERFKEGLSAQVMYVGAYADEGPAIKRLHEFIAEQGLSLRGKHHEIYLGDPRRCAPEKLRTIIRQPAG
jgi:hypothetical protein